MNFLYRDFTQICYKDGSSLTTKVLKMQLYFVNVGYGEAIVIKNDAAAIVIDGGPCDALTYEKKGTVRLCDFLRSQGIERIEAMILTHLHYDHVGGLYETAAAFPVKNFYTGIVIQLNRVSLDYISCHLIKNIATFMKGAVIYHDLLEVLTRKGTTIREIDKSSRLSFFNDKVNIKTIGISRGDLAKRKTMLENAFADLHSANCQKILYTFDKSENVFSLAQYVTVENCSFMLTADQSGIDRFTDELLPADVVKLTHHGQIDGMPSCLIEICKPAYFVICADIDRTYNSARPEIISRAEQYLKASGRHGGVFITGMLDRNFTSDKEICAVGFECQGEITAFPVLKR